MDDKGKDHVFPPEKDVSELGVFFIQSILSTMAHAIAGDGDEISAVIREVKGHDGSTVGFWGYLSVPEPVRFAKGIKTPDTEAPIEICDLESFNARLLDAVKGRGNEYTHEQMGIIIANVIIEACNTPITDITVMLSNDYNAFVPNVLIVEGEQERVLN